MLAAYVAIEGLGHAPRAVSLKMASKASMAAAMLEAPELTAALARLAATRSHLDSDSSKGVRAHEAAAIDVTLALQKGLLKKCDALDELSAQDLCNAMVGLARSPMILPEAAAKIVAAARGRCSELQSFRSMLDFSRAIGELMSVLEGPQRQLAADCFAETFPALISEAQKSFQNHDSIGLCLSGLARIAAALPKESSEAASFTKEVISPFAETILLICQDEDLQFLEIAAPLLQLCEFSVATWPAEPQPRVSEVFRAGPQVMSEEMSERVSEDMSERMSERMSKDMSEIVSERMSKDMSERVSEDLAERMSKDMSERMSEDMSKRMSKDMSERVSEDMPERMSQDMSEDMSKRMPKDMSERMSEGMPKDMSERMSEDMSEDMSERVSKDISERMSEDMLERLSEDM